MKIKSVLIAILAAVLSTAASGVAVADDAEGHLWIWGLGGRSCATFLEAERKNSNAVLPESSKEAYFTSDFSPYVQWIAGWVSAASDYNDTEKSLGVGGGEDIYNTVYLVRQYCEENPLDDIWWAASNATEQLIDHAGRR